MPGNNWKRHHNRGAQVDHYPNQLKTCWSVRGKDWPLTAFSKEKQLKTPQRQS